MDELLRHVIDAHGGLERWLTVKRLDARLTLTGYLFCLKQHPLGLRAISANVETQRPRVLLHPFPVPGSRGLFESETVRITADDGTVTSFLNGARESFEGHKRITPWSSLQLLYFAGYLAWNYLTLPFLLASERVQCREISPHEADGETWRVLQATFPDEIPTHNSEQRFYFDADFMLRRHDFVTDIARGRAALLCFDNREFDGFFFPTRSRVVVRDSRNRALANGPSSIWIDLESMITSRD